VFFGDDEPPDEGGAEAGAQEPGHAAEQELDAGTGELLDALREIIDREPTEAGQTRRRPSPKRVQVTLYLSPESARLLDVLRLELLYEYGLKTTKSQLADYAVRSLGERVREGMGILAAEDAEQD